MKKAKSLYAGGCKAIVGEKQAEARSGRTQNKSAKKMFREGGVFGSQRTDAKHRAAVISGKKAGSDE
jgi:hypothetical protein